MSEKQRNTGFELVELIEQARAHMYDVAMISPIARMSHLEERFNNSIQIKREDLQSVFSFKLRGAYNKLKSLSTEQLKKGVMAASAGNHAQGVALAAKRCNTQAIVIMPQTTPSIKVEAVRRMGVEVELHGDDYDEAASYAYQRCETEGKIWVAPYDDIHVIAGQGTVAAEIDEQCKQDLDVVFVPCGGGGLLAGVAAWFAVKRPEVRIVGVEAADAASMSAAFAAGERVVLPEVGLFADGAAVAQAGQAPFDVLRALDNIEMMSVSTEEMCAAIKDIYVDTRSIAEPAGALALAGLKKYVTEQGVKNKSLLAIHSGANLNFNSLRFIAENTELGEEQEALFSVTIPERPGSFMEFCKVLGTRSITEFNYRCFDDKDAQIFVGIATPDGDGAELMGKIEKAGYQVSNLSDNFLAKRHIRHMVGGRATTGDEVLYRVQFPERPGALLNFLTILGSTWNITLFHYRSHGVAYGRVLVGLCVPPKERDQVVKKLDSIGYKYWEESDNIAYRHFL